MSDLAIFRDTHVRIAQADALIHLATTVRDWKLLEDAVDAKIGEQEALVGWWEKHVRGDGRPKTVEDRATVSAGDAYTRSGFSKQQVSRWRTALKDTNKYRERQIQAAMRKAGIEAGENHRAECSGEFEWYTPGRYIDLARTVMGGIDLDPATSLLAQQTVRADAYYTAAENGLAQPWHGRVWLNPPYNQPTIMQFIEKLVEEYAAGQVQQAVLLTHNYTDTAWFHLAESAAELICFTKGRISFVNADGDSSQPTSGQAFCYFGPAGAAFREAFAAVGFIR